MDTTASEIGGIFCQVHGTQPLHHPVVGPLLHLWWGDAILWEQRTPRASVTDDGIPNIPPAQSIQKSAPQNLQLNVHRKGKKVIANLNSLWKKIGTKFQAFFYTPLEQGFRKGSLYSDI